jgi:transcription elongation GreA/GreB family factor
VKATRSDLRRDLLAAAEAALATARAAHAAAVEGATHSEAKAENDKDTRGLEQSYLARGHAARVEELEAALVSVAALSTAKPGPRIALGAVATVDDDGSVTRYYLAPWGGGVTLAGGIAVVTPTSPIGRALIGKAVGEVAEVHRPGGVREFEIVAIG